MSSSTNNLDRITKLREEIDQLRANMYWLSWEPVTCIKDDATFEVVLYGGVKESLAFPPEIADEVVTALLDICKKRYQQSRAEFDKLVIPEE